MKGGETSECYFMQQKAIANLSELTFVAWDESGTKINS